MGTRLRRGTDEGRLPVARVTISLRARLGGPPRARSVLLESARSGTVEFKLVANMVPGDVTAAHIHVGPKGAAGPVVQPLPPTPGAENGVVAEGNFTNAALVAAIQANPDGYYVNVHTGPPGVGRPSGVIRGQLGDRGPLNQ